MPLSRNKAIFALIPFFATTVGVIIFLLFFNYADITFSGKTPFQILYNNQTYSDKNSYITFHIQANSEQSFIVKKQGYDDQTITKTLSIWGKENTPITFTYTPIVESTTFAKPITYPGRSDITDNQSTDLITSSLPNENIDIPQNFTKVVWAKDGISACLFNTKDPTVSPRLWEKKDQKITLNKLPENTFECFSTDQGLMSVQMQAGKLLTNGQSTPLTLAENFYVTVSPNGKFVLLSTFESHTGTGSSLITILDREKNTTREIHTTNLKEYPRFIGTNTIALHAGDKITLYTPGKDPREVNKNIDLRTLVYSEETDTLYYPDTITVSNQAKLDNLFSVFQPPEKAHGIIGYNVNTKDEKFIFNFPDIEQNVFWGKIYPNQKQLIFLTGEQGTTKLQITIAP